MDAADFERITRSAGLKPAEMVHMPECVIYVADGFKNDKPTEYSWGYYQTMWATSRDGVDVAQCLEFDAFHDPEYPKEDKQRLRVGAAVKEAVKWAGINVESGRYDH